MMFEGNESFKWSFVSPPARYRPGIRTGKFEVWKDEIPKSFNLSADVVTTDWEEVRRSLLGISVADLAVAVAEEAEAGQKVGSHWSAVGELVDDVPRSGLVSI